MEVVIIPLNPRVRANNVFGTTTDNPLAAGSVTFNSPDLADLNVIINKHATITLDPLRQFGNPEIVIVTVHTINASIATITRGTYNTTPRDHPQGTLWVHAPLDEDFIEIVTSVTRPTDPYHGQMIFETDTNKLVGYGGIDWAPRDAGGQLGYAEKTDIQGGITTETDIIGLSTTVDVATNRRIRISVYGVIDGSVANDVGLTRIKEGVTTITGVKTMLAVNNAQDQMSLAGSRVLTPSAGSHTYRISLDRSTGTGILRWVATATVSTHILVEDIGAA